MLQGSKQEWFVRENKQVGVIPEHLIDYTIKQIQSSYFNGHLLHELVIE